MFLFFHLFIFIAFITQTYAYPPQQFDINNTHLSNYLNDADYIKSFFKKPNNTERLKQLENKYKALPSSVRKDIYNFYVSRQFEPLWGNSFGLHGYTFAIQNAINEEVYYTTPINQFTSIQLQENTPNERALLDLDLTLTTIHKALIIQDGLTSLRGEYGISETYKKSQFSAVNFLKDIGQKTVDQVMQSLRPQSELYLKLKQEIQTFSYDIQDIPQNVAWKRVIKYKDSSPITNVIIDRLKKLNYLSEFSPSFYNKKVIQAVKDFQKERQLKITGHVDRHTFRELTLSREEYLHRLLLNIERIRKMPIFHKHEFVRVNIPQFKLSLYKHGSIPFSTQVIVGRPDRPTPIFSHNITYIDLNPYWTVPSTIAQKDILPKLKKNPNYLKRNNISLYHNNKPVENITKINWKQFSFYKGSYVLKQSPGPHNALGQMKFMFPNKHAVYLHDTHSKPLFKRNRRAFSSGCIRVQNPQLLANHLLKNIISPARIKTLLNKKKNKAVSLKRKVPISLDYLTTSFDSQKNKIIYHNDIYHYDHALLNLLQKSAIQKQIYL